MTSSKFSNWQSVHRALVSLSKQRSQLDYEEGLLLLQARRHFVWVKLGMGSFEEYVERVLGHNRRMARERLRVAEALEGLPELRMALREGELSWSTIRELTRVAVADTEHAWKQEAVGKTVRQVEELVSGRLPGDVPDSPVRENEKRRVLRLEVTAETYATFREAVGRLRQDADDSFDDETALLIMARQSLHSGRQAEVSEGRASYQVAMTVCSECQRGWQQARGQQVEVPAEVVQMAACDSQELPAAHVGQPQTRASQTTPPATRRNVIARDKGCCVVPGCGHSQYLDVHHITLRSEGGNHSAANVITLCGGHHRAVHRGHLLIQGDAEQGLSFSHADGTAYGQPVAEDNAVAFSDAFSALKQMGFRQGESQRALERVRASAQGDTSVGQILRAALRELYPAPSSALVREPRGIYIATPYRLRQSALPYPDPVPTWLTTKQLSGGRMAHPHDATRGQRRLALAARHRGAEPHIATASDDSRALGANL